MTDILARPATSAPEGPVPPQALDAERAVLGAMLLEHEAIGRAQALALRVLADRLDHGEPVPQVGGVFAVAP